MRIVLSTVRWALEDVLVARGETVLAIVPATVLDQRTTQADGRYQLLGVDAWGDSGQLAQIANTLIHQQVQSIDSTDEQCLRAAALLRSMLHVKGQTSIQALRATDKAVMKEVLAKAGVPTARHQRIDTVADAPAAARTLGWPLVIKPRRGFATLGTRIVSSHADLGQMLATGGFDGTDIPEGLQASGMHLPMDALPGGLLVEELIDVAAEYHVEILRWKGEELYTIPGRYPAPLLDAQMFGAFLLQPGQEFDQVVALARAAADALELETGFAHAEVLRATDGNLLIGEIGLRPGGAQLPRLLELQHGIDVAEVAADLAMGQRPDITLRPTTGIVAWAASPAPQGLITAITPTADILALPGVIDAATSLAVGQDTSGRVGSAAHGAHVYARATTSELAAHRATAALNAWQVTLAPDPGAPAAS